MAIQKEAQHQFLLKKVCSYTMIYSAKRIYHYFCSVRSKDQKEEEKRRELEAQSTELFIPEE
jgi:hypothetical protein